MVTSDSLIPYSAVSTWEQKSFFPDPESSEEDYDTSVAEENWDNTFIILIGRIWLFRMINHELIHRICAYPVHL